MNPNKKREIEAKLRAMLSDNKNEQIESSTPSKEINAAPVRVIRRRKGMPDKKIL